MARRGRAAARRDQGNKTLAFIFGAITLLIIFVAVYMYYKQEKPINESNMCPASGPLGQYVLLIDTTDPFSFIQKQAYKTFALNLLKRDVPPGYLLSVFTLGEKFEDSAEPIIEICNPGDGSDKSELTTTISKLQKRYKEKYTEPILKIIESVDTDTPASQSPIFEMIQLVSINGFKKHAIAGDKHLIIISDMLHNTSGFSMYSKGQYTLEALMNSNYGKKISTDLQDVEVELLFLVNTPQFQSRQQQYFWEQYFDLFGGHVEKSRPL